MAQIRSRFQQLTFRSHLKAERRFGLRAPTLPCLLKLRRARQKRFISRFRGQNRPQRYSRYSPLNTIWKTSDKAKSRFTFSTKQKRTCAVHGQRRLFPLCAPLLPLVLLISV